MDINQFKSKLQFGGARPNLFRVIMTFPNFATAGGETEEMSFMCKGAQIPPATKGVIEVPFLGRQLKVAGDTTFEEWPLTVYNDNDFLIRNALERWANAINSHAENVGIVAPQEYMADAIVEQLDRAHNVVKTYRMIDLWPSSVEAIDLSFESTDTIEEFGVTFQYQYWESDTTT